MTSRTPSWPADDPSASHPDIDLLSDLAEDLTDSADRPALRRHLGDCQDCADTYAALAEVRELLGATDTPPMPADVAARIDAALAAEAVSAQPARAPLTQGRSAQGQAAQDRSAQASAASAAPTETARVTPEPVSAPPKRSPGSTGPGVGTGISTGPGRRPRRRGRLLMGAAALVAALGVGVFAVQQNGSLGHNDSASASAARSPADQHHPALTSGEPVYREDQLTQQIQQLLAAPGSRKAESSNAQPRTADSQAPAISATPPVPDCVPAATGRGSETPLAVGRGSFGTTDVAALVYPLADQPGRLDVYLVTSTCPDATVLLHRTVPAR